MVSSIVNFFQNATGVNNLREAGRQLLGLRGAGQLRRMGGNINDFWNVRFPAARKELLDAVFFKWFPIIGAVSACAINLFPKNKEIAPKSLNEMTVTDATNAGVEIKARIEHVATVASVPLNSLTKLHGNVTQSSQLFYAELQPQLELAATQTTQFTTFLSYNNVTSASVDRTVHEYKLSTDLLGIKTEKLDGAFFSKTEKHIKSALDSAETLHSLRHQNMTAIPENIKTQFNEHASNLWKTTQKIHQSHQKITEARAVTHAETTQHLTDVVDKVGPTVEALHRQFVKIKGGTLIGENEGSSAERSQESTWLWNANPRGWAAKCGELMHDFGANVYNGVAATGRWVRNIDISNLGSNAYSLGSVTWDLTKQTLGVAWDNKTGIIMGILVFDGTRRLLWERGQKQKLIGAAEIAGAVGLGIFCKYSNVDTKTLVQGARNDVASADSKLAIVEARL